MQDPGAGRSDGERAGDRPSSDMPPIERQSAGPYSRRRIRAHSTPPRGVVRGRHDVAQRVPAPVIRLTSADTPHVSATLLGAALEAVTTAGQRSTLGEVGAALVEGVTGALDLRSAYLYLLEEALTDPCLRLIAQTGEHAAFMSEVPTIALEADLPVVRVVIARTPEFDADPHRLGQDVGSVRGVGRWRAAVGAQAEAILPLLVRGRAIGALTLSWRDPRTFSPADRHGLETLAAAVAIAVDPFAGRSAPGGATTGRELTVGLYAVDAAGAVTRGAGARPPVLRVATAAPGDCGCDRATFCEVTACADGRTAIALGVVETADGSACERAHEAERLLAGWMGQGLEPAASLDALGSWSGRQADLVAHPDAVLCVIDVGRRCVTYCTSGHALVAVLAGGSRYLAAPVSAGSPGPATELASVLLPGDRLVLWSGDAPGLDADEGQAFVRDVLGSTPAPAAWRLIRPAGSGVQHAEVGVVVDFGV